jgi:CHAD domain-containing protein
MKPRNPVLHRPAVDVAKVVARDDLERWVKARRRLGRNRPEGVHDFRVALRRLRSTLRAFRTELKAQVPRRTRRRLRRLARAAGTSRNLQVGREWLLAQLDALSPSEQPGAQWLIARVAARQDDADKRLAKRVARGFTRLKRTLRRSLDDRESSPDGSGPAKRARVVIRDALRRWTRELEHRLMATRTVADWEEAHAARISAKHIRYLLRSFKQEIAGAPAVIEELAALQDVLGSLQDGRVLAGELRAAFVEAAGERAQRTCDELLPWAPVAESAAELSPPTDEAGLIALARRIGDEYEATFVRFRHEWLEERAASLLFQLHEIGGGRKPHPRRALGGLRSWRAHHRPGVPVAIRPIRRRGAGKTTTRKHGHPSREGDVNPRHGLSGIHPGRA